MRRSLEIMRRDREFDEVVARGLGYIVEAVEQGDEESAAWLLGRDVELISRRYSDDGLFDAARLSAAVSRARELVPEAVP